MPGATLRDRWRVALPWLLGLVVGGLAMWAVQARRPEPPPQPQGRPSAPGDSATRTPATDPAQAPTAVDAPALPAAPSEASGQARTAAAETPAQAGPLRIAAEPETLRVWSNTTVRLRAEVLEEMAIERFVWHFEDGSAAVQGIEVEHTFAESVRDRHVTVEAFRKGLPALVASRRLAVERLDVVPLDGQLTEVQTPKKRGTRLLFAVGVAGEDLAESVAAAAAKAQVDAVVTAGEPADLDTLEQQLGQQAPMVALIRWAIEPGPEGAEERNLRVVKDAGEVVSEVQVGDKSAGVLAIGEVALTAIDTRGETIGEPELKRARLALTAASAYPGSLLLSPRPLTLLRDGELIADRAYRIYEHALRLAVTAVISASSEVFYDGRFGGLALAAVGRAKLESCPRLTGQDACQQPSVTLIEFGAKRRLTVLHLLAPDFATPAQPRDLPPEVGKVRR